jgi:hypothetical protein
MTNVDKTSGPLPEPPYVSAAVHITSADSAALQAVARVRGVTLKDLCNSVLADALNVLVITSAADRKLDKRRQDEADRLYAMARSPGVDKVRAREMRKYAAKIRDGRAPLPSASTPGGREGPRTLMKRELGT